VNAQLQAIQEQEAEIETQQAAAQANAQATYSDAENANAQTWSKRQTSRKPVAARLPQWDGAATEAQAQAQAELQALQAQGAQIEAV